MKLSKTFLIGLATMTVCLAAALAFYKPPQCIIVRSTSSAILSVRMIVGAATQYQTQYGHYPESFEQLSQLKGTTSSDQKYAWLAGPTWANHSKNGYVFTYRAFDREHEGKLDSFTVNADPIEPARTGYSHFFSRSEDGIVRAAEDQPASAKSPPLGN